MEGEFQLKQETLVATIEAYEQLSKDLVTYKEEQQLILNILQNWDSELSQSFRESYSKMLNERYSELEEKCQKITEILQKGLEETNRLLNRRDDFPETLGFSVPAEIPRIWSFVVVPENLGYSSARSVGGILKLDESLRSDVETACDEMLEIVEKEKLEAEKLREIFSGLGITDWNLDEELNELEACIVSQRSIENFKESFVAYCDGVKELDTYLTEELAKVAEAYGDTLDFNTYTGIRENGLNKEVNKVLVSYINVSITKEQMETFGWAEMTNEEIERLNEVLSRYGITDPASIALFFATCAAESGYGASILENGSDEYFEEKKYEKAERGVGYIQLTHRELHLAFLKYKEDSYNGQETAEYIAEHYVPWEVSAYVWSVKKHGKGVILNDYVSEHGGSIEVFLVTQYFVNSYKTGIDKILREIREGSRKYSIDSESKQLIPENSKPFELPENWEDRETAYNCAIQIFM